MKKAFGGEHQVEAARWGRGGGGRGGGGRKDERCRETVQICQI